MADSITQWLENLGLGRYAPTFAEQEILHEDLAELTDADLRELEIPLGPRKRILKALAALMQARSTPESAPAKQPASEANLAAWERHPGERKPVTMLFADITGSTALTEKLDAEEAHDLLYGATQRMCAAVERNRGTVCRFMGDGMMAMFGAPAASEHHAVDACQAAIEMQQAVQAYAAEVEARYSNGLKIRVGLHSGEVVVLTVGEGDTPEYDASGPTVPIAARMEQCAVPGRINLTAATQALAGNRIEVQALAPVAVKGISEPLAVFVLRAVKSIEEAVSATARTPFVGRRGELIQFHGMLEACIEEGQGRTVYLRGEPGIGKTRLLEEFSNVAAEMQFSYHRGLILPFGVGKGQDAIRALVRSLLGITLGGGKALRQDAAATALSDGWIDPDQVVFLNDLLDLPQPTELRGLYDAMDPAMRNQGMQAVVSALVIANSGKQPVLAVVEDVHWTDPATLAHLAALTKVVADCPALLVMTSRIEGDPLDPQWRSATGGSPFFTIDLGPLRKQDSVGLISSFIDAADPLAVSCLERAAGNPLFLEQLLHAAQEGSSTSLPDSIQSLVLARMDRLEAGDKAALQAAAVIGLRFHADTLKHLLDTSDYDCAELVRHNLIRPEGDGYLFAHALIQEGIYGSLLKPQRYALHRQAAGWYAGKDATLHAEHLAAANDPGAPMAFFEAAREQAQQYRFERALELAERALVLVTASGEQHRLICLKGELLRNLADIQSSINAYRDALDKADDDVQRCDAWLGIAAGMRVLTDYHDALELIDKAEPVLANTDLAERQTHLHHLRGNLYFSLGRADACRDEHLLALEFARQCQSTQAQAQALGGLGDAEYVRGRMRTACEHYSRCIDLSRRHGHGRIEVAHLAQRAHALLYSGQIQQTKIECQAAVDVAVKVGDHRAEMNACVCFCNVCFELGEYDQIAVHAQRQLDLARMLGARAWESHGLMWQAITLHVQGRQSEARAVSMEAVQITREAGRAFNAGRALGAAAWLMAAEDSAREAALEEGEAALREGIISHNYFYFYRFAIDALLGVEDWDRIDSYAAALEDYSRHEPLLLTDFIIARGHALAAFGRGGRDAALLGELQRLRDEAGRLGFKSALPVIARALASV